MGTMTGYPASRCVGDCGTWPTNAEPFSIVVAVDSDLEFCGQHTEVHMNAKEHGCATHRGNHPDDSVREALAWIAEAEALILQMKDAPSDPKLWTRQVSRARAS